MLLWPDAIRVAAIIGVVTIHSFRLPPLTSDWLHFDVLINWLWFISVKTSVPLFLLLSGALLLGKIETDRVFYSKRARRVLVPWLLWAVIFLCSKYQAELTSIPHALKTLGKILSADFTFLPALFCLYMLMPFMTVLVSRLSVSKRWQLIGLWFLGVSLLPYLRNSMAFPAAVDNGLVRQTINYSGYILLGYELRQLLERKLRYPHSLTSALVVFCASVVGTFAIQLRQSANSHLYLSYVAPLIVTSSLAAFCAIAQIAQRLEHHSTNTLIRKFSTASFGVFFVHPLVLLYVRPVILSPDRITQNVVVALQTLVVSFTIILLLQQIPWLRNKIS